MNINILGISELQWTGMGEFNSDDHYIYYCGQESLRRNGVALIVNKSPKSSTWLQSQKDRMISVRFQGKLFNIALYSIGPRFYHQSHPQLGIVFAFAPSHQYFWSYFSTDLQLAYWALTNLGSSSFSVLSFCHFILFMGF